MFMPDIFKLAKQVKEVSEKAKKKGIASPSTQAQSDIVIKGKAQTIPKSLDRKALIDKRKQLSLPKHLRAK
jgi:hypothetical protein